MQKIFIANKEFEREYSRSRAKGHTSIVIDKDVEVTDTIHMVTDGSALKIEKAEDTGEDEVYVIPCKEFGLTDYEGTEAKVSVIFCDNGWMLVTLLQGAVIVNLDDELLMPTIGDVKAPKVVKDDILWVDADSLLAYSKYLDSVQSKFVYDYEFVMTVTGQLINGMRNFKIKFAHEEDVDLSLGYIAQYVQAMQTKEDARMAKKIAESVTVGSSGYQFDDDEDEESYEDDEEDDEYDVDDYDF